MKTRNSEAKSGIYRIQLPNQKSVVVDCIFEKGNAFTVRVRNERANLENPKIRKELLNLKSPKL